jgi:transcriptional regulator with XRE-family HTH domain
MYSMTADREARGERKAERTGRRSGGLGAKLRAVRDRKGLSLRAVALKAGVSESLVSQIERERISPSIDTLLALAEVLEVDLEYLFSDWKRTKRVSVVRKVDRARRVVEGVRYEQLSGMTDSSEQYGIEAVMLQVPPGRSRGSSVYGHPGKELGVIVSGSAELAYGTETYALEEGDSVSFASDIPHVLRNVGRRTLAALWVNTPPRLQF